LAAVTRIFSIPLRATGGGGGAPSGWGLPGVGVVERDSGPELDAALCEWADREERNWELDSLSSGFVSTGNQPQNTSERAKVKGG
jgi:hypothetical protein